jgi:1,4-dihydroxy-2-naphthoyl-CoA synthase
MRRLRLRNAEADDHDLIAMCYMSEDFREGQAAFLEKRPPRWKGR